MFLLLILLFLKEQGASAINEKLFEFLVNLQCANSTIFVDTSPHH